MHESSAACATRLSIEQCSTRWSRSTALGCFQHQTVSRTRPITTHYRCGLLEFLVRSDGAADPESIQAWKATSIDFLRAVLAVVPEMRFYPMRMAGCDVAALVQMPFVFSLNRR